MGSNINITYLFLFSSTRTPIILYVFAAVLISEFQYYIGALYIGEYTLSFCYLLPI